MTVSLNYSGLSSAALFDGNGGTTIAQVLNVLPTAIIYTTPTTAPTSDNLTFIGSFANGDTVWRIANAGPAVSGVTLESTSPGFLNNSLSVTANSFTYVRSTAGSTHRLTIGGVPFVKAAGPTTISLGNPTAPTGQTTISRVDPNVAYNITGSNFNDTLSGGNLADTISGGDGDDVLAGNLDNDIIWGGTGNDSISGGTGNDSIWGGAGNDSMWGAAGSDTLTGGAGADRFAYGNSTQGIDTIADFSIADSEVLQFARSGFGGSTALPSLGTLSSTQFLSGAGVTSAADGDQRFIYNTTNGDLWFDVDGVGGTASVQIATLTGAPTITNNNIFIV